MGQSLIAFAPWEVAVSSEISPELDATSFLVSAIRKVPVATLLPQVTKDSYLMAMGLAIGPRLVDGSYDRLRFRLTGARVALQRAYTSGGVTLVDYNQTGFRMKEITWFGASFGPGVHIQRLDGSFWLRAVGMGNVSTLESGSLLFGSSGQEAQTGFVYQVSAQSGLSFSDVFRMSASLGRETMKKADLGKDHISVEAQFDLKANLSVSAGFAVFEFKDEDESRKANQLSFSIRFTPGNASY